MRLTAPASRPAHRRSSSRPYAPWVSPTARSVAAHPRPLRRATARIASACPLPGCFRPRMRTLGAPGFAAGGDQRAVEVDRDGVVRDLDLGGGDVLAHAPRERPRAGHDARRKSVHPAQRARHAEREPVPVVEVAVLVDEPHVRHAGEPGGIRAGRVGDAVGRDDVRSAAAEPRREAHDRDGVGRHQRHGGRARHVGGGPTVVAHDARARADGRQRLRQGTGGREDHVDLDAVEADEPLGQLEQAQLGAAQARGVRHQHHAHRRAGSAPSRRGSVRRGDAPGWAPPTRLSTSDGRRPDRRRAAGPTNGKALVELTGASMPRERGPSGVRIAVATSAGTGPPRSASRGRGLSPGGRLHTPGSLSTPGARVPSRSWQRTFRSVRSSRLLVPALALVAGLPFVNRIEPIVFGLPFLLFWILGWVLVTPLFLAVAYLLADTKPDRAAGGAER